jgi:hypothetical protein
MCVTENPAGEMHRLKINLLRRFALPSAPKMLFNSRTRRADGRIVR